MRQSRQSSTPPGEVEVALKQVVTVLRTYLELRSPEQLRPAYINDPSVRFRRREGITVEQYRKLYETVGRRWFWRDRAAWSDERLAAHLAHPTIVVWECCVGDATAGFFELARHDDGSIEIAYFGLVPEFIGHGLGKAMLTHAAEQAWAAGANRVWLHTCTLDSPHALPNYKARGFEEVRTETYEYALPAD